MKLKLTRKQINIRVSLDILTTIVGKQNSLFYIFLYSKEFSMARHFSPLMSPSDFWKLLGVCGRGLCLSKLRALLASYSVGQNLATLDKS